MRNTALIIGALLALLGAAMVFAYAGLMPYEGAPPLGVHGWTAMIIGAVFSIIVGCGLMALLFYSNRHGYDEPPQIERERQPKNWPE